MEDLNEGITEKEFYMMVAEGDPENTGMLDFNSFRAIITNKRASEKGSTK